MHISKCGKEVSAKDVPPLQAEEQEDKRPQPPFSIDDALAAVHCTPDSQPWFAAATNRKNSTPPGKLFVRLPPLSRLPGDSTPLPLLRANCACPLSLQRPSRHRARGLSVFE